MANCDNKVDDVADMSGQESCEDSCSCARSSLQLSSSWHIP